MNNIQETQDTYKQLTHREVEVVKAAANGLTCKQTALQLGAAIKTIEVHRYNVLRKLQTNTTAGAVAILIRTGVIA